MKKVLTIAGSDCSGGAGIQADLKTMTAHKVYGMSVITALTAQNTTGVAGVIDAPAEFVAQQIDSVMTDIFPDAIKIGMVSSADIIHVIAKKMREYPVKNIVADPVMISTSGSKLLKEDAVEALTQELLPLADIITPNISEAEVLSGTKIQSVEDMVSAATIISQQYDGYILIKGGHLRDSADDLLCRKGEEVVWYPCERLNSENTHGTGCTLSSAIACGLAQGLDMKNSVEQAKRYILCALKAQLNLGKGNGPLNHCCNL